MLGWSTRSFHARVQSLLKDVSNAFKRRPTVGRHKGRQRRSTGVYWREYDASVLGAAAAGCSNRANPKLGQIGEAGEQAVDASAWLPRGNFDEQYLTKAKRNKMSKLKSELLIADPAKLFSATRDA